MISILLIAATLSASSFPLALAQSPAPSSVDVKVGDEVVFQFLGDDKLIPKFKTHAPCDIETGSVFSGYISSACGSPHENVTITPVDNEDLWVECPQISAQVQQRDVPPSAFSGSSTPSTTVAPSTLGFDMDVVATGFFNTVRSRPTDAARVIATGFGQNAATTGTPILIAVPVNC